MREIKFRAWVKPNKKMVMVTGLCYETDGLGVENLRDGETDIDNPNTQEFWWAGKESILMQYTGLKDKNGKEIYEGDMVVSGIKGSISPLRNDCPKYQVGFKNGTFICGKKANIHLSIINEDCEVIGNIYENPELLKEK